LIGSAALLLSALDIVAGCERPVAAQATRVIISPSSVTLSPSQNMQFTGFGLTSAGDTVKVGLIWSAVRGNVSSSGLYSAPTPGQDRVCVRVGPGGIPDCAQVEVWPGQVISWPEVDTVQQFATKRVMPNVGGEATTWTASGGNITPSGLYTAPASLGEYQVCAQAPGFLRCERVLVTSSGAAYDTSKAVPVASVTVTPPDARGAVGQTFQLAATLKDSRGEALPGVVDSRGRPHPAGAVTWATSNPAVATVNGSGLVTGKTPGVTTIIATSEGKSGTSSVTVTKGLTRSRPSMNAADSVRVQLPSAAVAVAVPVEVRQDSDVIVRLLLDPRASKETLSDWLASDGAEGMHIQPGTTLYSPSMTALLTAPGDDVSQTTPAAQAVPSTDRTGWTWVLHTGKPGRRQLWITLSARGVAASGADLTLYSFAPHYIIRRDWWLTLRAWGDRVVWVLIGAVIATLVNRFLTRKTQSG